MTVSTEKTSGFILYSPLPIEAAVPGMVLD
jgi:hypothetical protein